MAENSRCSAECKTQLGCKGTMEAKKATIVTNNKALDYAVEGTDMSKYGFLQVLTSGPLARERIYIPQHPTGWAKHSATIVDCDDNAMVKTRGMRGPCGNNQVFYSAATQGGSSGSPVLVATDNNSTTVARAAALADL